MKVSYIGMGQNASQSNPVGLSIGIGNMLPPHPHHHIRNSQIQQMLTEQNLPQNSQTNQMQINIHDGIQGDHMRTVNHDERQLG